VSRSNSQRFVAVRWIALAATLLLAGCAPKLDLLTGPAPDLYMLNAPQPADFASAGNTPTAGSLLIEEPTAVGALDTDRIALAPAPFELKYFAGARWTDRAPRMLRHLVVEAFENSGRVRSVTDQTLGLPTDYSLRLELRDFEAELGSGRAAPVIHLRIKAMLLRRSPVAIAGTRIFDLRVTAAGNDMKTIVATFDEALARMLVQLVDWVATTAGAPPPD